MCAYRLPGKNFAILQDYQDDNETNAGAELLKMLYDAQIFKRAVYVVRWYSGEHLGPARFKAYVEAVQSAITHDPYNHISKENQTPWPKEKSATSAAASASSMQPSSQPPRCVQ